MSRRPRAAAGPADAGPAVADEVAEGGDDGSLEPGPGGGAPTVPVTVESATTG
ncbi:hypothetical protein SAMN06893096_104354 [Geodermatophilus pulveris]|uniref:Uncharacterized protein n=1 Tax=Geodermatophilus pulveris TaxID=1564159 RepID=A0A239EWY6_9ACTN|nr:hypothetical protein [Geodermatophilus pulveris]SNS49280.1 hypothetical protein SAMN06893096_104354 [Geodermatophilus pulveris]